MRPINQTIRTETSRVYQIVIQGALDMDWSARLGGLQIVTKLRRDGMTVTILTGEIVDQAALLGILNTLYDLRYPLLSLKQLDSVDMTTLLNE